MAIVDPFDFLKVLAATMAAATTPALQIAGIPRELWIGQAVEGQTVEGQTAGVENCAAVYGELTLYGGGQLPYVGPAGLPIQCMTRGQDVEAAFALAWKLHKTLQDDTERPRRMWSIGSPLKYRVNAIEPLGEPGQVGVDERSRAMVSFNFDARVVAL